MTRKEHLTMQIVNGAVQGLELETGFSTSSEISQMNNSLTFMSSYKWDMGDVNAFYVRKQLLSDQRDAKGNRIPYKGTVTEVAKAICLAEGMKEEEITEGYLFNRFNKDTDIQALSAFTRGIMVFVNGKKMTRRVLCKHEIDPTTGKKVTTTLDRIAGITGAIHQTLRKAEEDKCKKAGLAQDMIDDALSKFDEKHKLVRASKIRVAMEVCTIPVDPTSFAVKDGFAGLKGVIYTTSIDNYNALKGRLHTANDSHLDFLEVKISHPVVQHANKDVAKMQSGLKTSFESFDSTKSPANLLPNFTEDYLTYCQTAAQTSEDLKAKVMDYREISDEELLSICKDYVIKNYDILTDEEKEKYDEIVQRFQEVLTAEEIAQISNIQFAQSPNVQEAEGMTGVAPTQSEEEGDMGVFSGIDDEEDEFEME